MKGKITCITYKEAVDFLLPKHYSGRKPNITKAFGWYISDELVAVCTFGKPASNSLCEGVCGKENSKFVLELNRLCRVEDLTEPLSQFVSACLKRVANAIVVSYADSGMNHTGFIYQATNFYYTGQTKVRTDKYTEGNKHSRHYKNTDQNGLRKVRTSKYRYIFFSVGKRQSKLKIKWKQNLKYPILPYPKEENKNYIY